MKPTSFGIWVGYICRFAGGIILSSALAQTSSANNSQLLDTYLSQFREAKTQLLALEANPYKGLSFYERNFGSYEKIEARQTATARIFMNKINELFLKASNNTLDHPGLCSLLKKLRYYDDYVMTEPEAGPGEYEFSLCLRPNWPTDSEALRDQVGLSNEYPQQVLGEFSKNIELSLSWLVRNQTTIKALLAQNLADDNMSPASELEAQAITKLLNAGADLTGKVFNLEGSLLDGERNKYFLNQTASEEILLSAFGALPLAQFPEKIGGFDTRQVMALLTSWLGNEAMASIQYNNDARGELFYSLPAIKVLVNLYKNELTHVIVQQWEQMPLEKSSLWAIKEISVTTRAKVEDIAFATPVGVYVNQSYYAHFMNLYRANKQALTGDTIAASVNNLQEGLHGDLTQLRIAIEQNGELTDASLIALSKELGPSLNSMKNATWLNAIINLLR